MNNKTIFWLFGIPQSLTLGTIIFLIFEGLGTIGLDTQILLSTTFPLFLLLVEFVIFSKKSSSELN